jgi:putative membrane protein
MLTDKLLTLVFGLLFLLTIACSDATETEQQQAETPPAVKEMSRSAAFVDYATSTNMLHAELAQLAMERGQSEHVKALGEQMHVFYGDALARLREVATAEGLQGSLPDSLGSADRATIAEFRKLPPEQFDARYQQYIKSSHQSQLGRYQEMLFRTEEEKIREWINEMQLQLKARVQLAAGQDTAA